MGLIWITLSIIIIVYLIFRVVILLFGDWRLTLNRVITQYVAWKHMEPNYSAKELFLALLDARYPKPSKDIGGLRAKMHTRKNQIKQEIESGIGLCDKHDLPSLIYICLFIEENSYLSQKKSLQELLEPIKQEVIRQGFEKYC